ncbi:protein archease [Haemaphysalis longicornis]
MSFGDEGDCAELVERDDFSEEELSIPPVKYEYLDHTADVQLHGWGEDLTEAFEQVAVAMFAYMTEIDKVDIRATCDVAAEAEDMVGLLYHFLDELLFVFSAEPYIIGKKVKILEFDKEAFRIKARVYGEEFQLGKHPQGTEVKAITYSNMQVWDEPDQHEVFVIIDI